jgi:acyl-CoA reductase-like NAD-dependent aldehyde dehydrogenase
MATPAEPALSLATFHSWVGGEELVGRGGRRTATNPATGEAFAQASLLDAEQARQAIGVAHAAFPAWSRTSFGERSRLLDRWREAIVDGADEIAQASRRRKRSRPRCCLRSRPSRI